MRGWHPVFFLVFTIVWRQPPVVMMWFKINDQGGCGDLTDKYGIYLFMHLGFLCCFTENILIIIRFSFACYSFMLIPINSFCFL